MSKSSEIREYIEKNPKASNTDIAKKFGCSNKAVRDSRYLLKKGVGKKVQQRRVEKVDSRRPNEHKSRVETKDGIAFEYNGQQSIKTLEEAVKLFEIDTNEWVVDKFVCSSSEVAGRYRDQNLTWENGVMTGHAIRKNEWDTHVNYHVKVFVRRKEEKHHDYTDYAKVFKNLIDGYKPLKFKTINYVKKRGENNLLEINLYDLHLGKLCWEGETGYNFDSKIAPERYMHVLEELIKKGKGFGFNEILFTIGNDFYNSDTAQNTTYHGTPQNEDGRWQKIFSLGTDLLTKGIEMMRHEAPVHIKVVPGNHDWTRMFYAGETIKAFYRNAKDVYIDNSANPRKYFLYGNTLLGMTHGDSEKPEALRSLMAFEAKEEWAMAKFYEFHLGHWHRKLQTKQAVLVKHKQVDEELGLIIRHMSSLAGTDAWHHKNGYVGPNKAGEALLFNKETGYLGQFNVNIIL